MVPSSGRICCHDGDCGTHQVGQNDVVETDEGDFLLQLEIMKRADSAEGHQVVRGEQRARRIVELHKATYSGIAVVLGPQSGYLAGGPGQSRGGHRIDKPVLPAAGLSTSQARC